MKLGIKADVPNKKFACIYVIYSPSLKIYIGQTICFRKRLVDYRNFLGIKTQRQRKLFNSFKKYGEDKHFIDVVQICTREELNDLEAYYIKKLSTFNTQHGLNLTSGGGGFERSDETKQILREINTGKTHTEEHKLKIRETSKKTWAEIVQTDEYWANKQPSPLKGKKQSPEHAAKSRVAYLGRPMKQEQKDKLSEAGKGRVYSEERNRKISESKKGKKRAPFTDETRKNMSEAHKGKKLSPETIAKGIESRKGYKATDETKSKIGASTKERWQDPEYREKVKNGQNKAYAENKGKQRKKRGKFTDDELEKRRLKFPLGKKQNPETIAKRVATMALNKLKKQQEEAINFDNKIDEQQKAA